MPEAKKGDTVKVHYTGRFEDGEIFDSSTGKEPLEFTIGKGEVIPGFEEAIIGMNTGESKTVKIPPEKAYGPRYDELVLTVERSRFPDDMEPQLGQQLQLRQPDGQNLHSNHHRHQRNSGNARCEPPTSGKRSRI